MDLTLPCPMPTSHATMKRNETQVCNGTQSNAMERNRLVRIGGCTRMHICITQLCWNVMSRRVREELNLAASFVSDMRRLTVRGVVCVLNQDFQALRSTTRVIRLTCQNTHVIHLVVLHMT